MQNKIVIVGGVAGGASAATRARRLSEDAEIVMLERGPYVSFANCGLPYFIGGEITDRKKLTLQTPESLARRYRIDVRVRNEVVRILPRTKEVEVKRLDTGDLYRESYDSLVLATGAAPLRPPIPGIGSSQIFTVRDIPDVDRITTAIRSRNWKKVTLLGGGYIGIEMAEQLIHLGMEVTIIEALPQMVAPFDPEMAEFLHIELRKRGAKLLLSDPVAAFEEQADGTLLVTTKSGKQVSADGAILGLGVRPETAVAGEAGIAIGERGGIKVDEQLRTNIPDIWAVGDCIEVVDIMQEILSVIPLAGPANRQGRLVADNIFGAERTYAGTQGTAILRVFSLAAGCTGVNEKSLRRKGRQFKALHLHPGSHAGYFPGAKPIALKIIFEPAGGKLLGAQAVGEHGIDKRIDVLATAIKAGMTVHDLADLELAYAPPFGSAKDPVNIAGMAAGNILGGLVETVGWNELQANEFLLDVRDDAEVAKGGIPGALHIPLDKLRERLSDLPKDREIVAYCHSGQRSYYACRILSQHGYKCRNLSGAWRTWSTVQQTDR